MSSLSASETTAVAERARPATAGAAVEAGEVIAGGPFDTSLDYDYAIRVQNVHVTYRSVIDPRSNTLRHSIARMGRGTRTARKIHAVRGVNFDVPYGSVLGIIGANGAGKSTIMRAIAGILPPTEGRVVVNGRISTLLALGVGFNGQLSGRENVILGSLAAGLTRAQVDERFEQIADWAELGEYIDMPMKAYSSGMYGRLAFAVSTHLDPDLLLIDEALSTGDAHFRQKSYEKMQELVGQARTIIIVSHGIGAIREMCDDCIWMDKGQIIMRGDPHEVAAEYLKSQGVVHNTKIEEAAESGDDADTGMDDFQADGV